jgi:hypothetical protein
VKLDVIRDVAAVAVIVRISFVAEVVNSWRRERDVS